MPKKEHPASGLVESRFDFGRGREGSLRFEDAFEIEIGTKIMDSTITIQEGSLSDDAQVRIHRTEGGFEVSIHGFWSGEPWGLLQNAPRLRLTVDPSSNVASIHLVTGSDRGKEERLLNQMNMNR